ncbi:MAG: hypothetical protein O2930_10925 [Acidobacteria bacterium]|nr:hypothetical protein [Acidobacteriota bacterium]
MTATTRRRRLSLCVVTALVVAAALAAATPLAARQARDILDRAIADFEAGRVVESVQGFDAVVDVAPTLAPQLWQRGIAQYYAGRYTDCRAQFELHRTVNPADVENAAWHFLCVAGAESAPAARAALLPVGPDPRVPMRQVYQMFLGTLTPEKVLAAAGEQASAQFYAQLYVGLYFEALGQDAQALAHITAAADGRFARVGGYMHTVARVHLLTRDGR